MVLEIGTNAPGFTAVNDSGEKVSLSDFKGRWVVLYFYPKDDTLGCTKEACDFRDNMQSLTEHDAVVIGVSPDSVKSHTKFKDKFDLNFQLIADEEKKILNDYGVMGEKSMFGKKYIGVIRSTYIIDPDGIIREIYSKVRVPRHVKTVIKKLNELKNK